ncbi:hypothetical protein Agub_g6333, partial [Astrephomene gubernaculifera]
SSSTSSGAPGAAAAPVPASAAQLSAQQRAAIRQAHLFDPLPEGYCFNGTQYFDAFGDASLEHPHMDRFIAEWLAEQRAQQTQEASQAAASKAAAGGGLVVTRVLGPVRWW